jgi:hypothetical protein
LLVSCAFFGPVDLLAWVLQGDWRLGVGAFAVAGVAGALVWALRALERGEQERVGPTFAVAPVMIVALSLPYLEGAALRRILFMSGPVAVGAAAIWAATPRALPLWPTRLVAGSSLAIAARAPAHAA